MPNTEPGTEWIEASWLELHADLTRAELSGLSGLPVDVLDALLDWGVIAPVDPGAAEPRFNASSLTVVRAASRLRRDFSLDTSGLALALTYVERIRTLEAQLGELRARMPQRPPGR